MSRFTLPRDIYYGKGSISELESLRGERAVLVLGGGSMRRFGFVDKAISHLDCAGMSVKIIENVESDPSVDTVMAGAKVMRDFAPDWIVAMGGGSPIDAAKAMWVFYEYPELTFGDILKPFSMPTLRGKAKFCAIPSTSGTASEVTIFSVITDYDKGIKYPLADYNIAPDVAILDPELAEKMPAKLTAHTGMDALTHAIEAYVSTLHSHFTDPLALCAIKLIYDNILKSYQGDSGARESMHYAQCLAGMAFSNALLGIVHSMAHKTGAIYSGGHIVHGCANAMYLPKVIKYNSKDNATAERYADIARFIGLKGDTVIELADKLIAEIRALNDSLGIPSCIAHYGEGGIKSEQSIIDSAEYELKLDEVARLAVEDACTASNPRVPTIEEMKQLLLAVYYDREIDF